MRASLSTIGAMVAVSIISFSAPGAPSDADRSNGELFYDTHVKLPGFGLSFTAPAGWMRGSEEARGQLSKFYQLKEGKLACLLDVELVPAKVSSVQKIATGLGGVIIPKAASSDSQIVEMTLASTEQFSARAAAVMTVRDQLVVFVVEEAGTGKALADLRSVIASVVTSAPKPAADDLTLRKRPIALFDSAVLIRLPEPFRPDKVENPAVRAFFGAYDWPSARLDAVVNMNVIPNPNGATIGDFVKDLAQKIGASVKSQTPLAFEIVNDKPPVYLSQPLPTRPQETERLMITTLDDSRFALVGFVSLAPSADVRDQYMAMAKEVARTAKISLAYQAGRRVASPSGNAP